MEKERIDVITVKQGSRVEGKPSELLRIYGDSPATVVLTKYRGSKRTALRRCYTLRGALAVADGHRANMVEIIIHAEDSDFATNGEQVAAFLAQPIYHLP